MQLSSDPLIRQRYILRAWDVIDKAKPRDNDNWCDVDLLEKVTSKQATGIAGLELRRKDRVRDWIRNKKHKKRDDAIIGRDVEYDLEIEIAFL